MNIKLLINLLNKYFVYIGFAHKLETGGIFADVNLEERLMNLSDEYKTNLQFKSMIDAIQSWDGEFDSLEMSERALADLMGELFPDEYDQGIIIEKWYEHCGLINDTKSLNDTSINEGLCYALSHFSGLHLFLGKTTIAKLSKKIDTNRLFDFESLLKRIANWDDGELNADLEEDFKILKLVVSMQKNLYEPFEGFRILYDILKTSYDPELNLAFVHNEASLAYLFRKIMQPGNFIIFSAANHAARATVTQDGKIIYYNPNEHYGYLSFDLSHIEYFLRRIPNGFSNCYQDRFGLNVTVYNTQCTSALKDDFNKLLNKLIEIRVATNPLPMVLDKKDSSYRTALYLSCYHNNFTETRTLLNMGANPNVKDVEGNFPLMLAVIRSNTLNMRCLLSSPTIEVNAFDSLGYTPLHTAVVLGSINPVLLLIHDKRIRLNLRANNAHKQTALHLALRYKFPEIAKLLIENDIIRLHLTAYKEKFTSLHLAAIQGYGDIISLIISKQRCGINATSEERNDEYPKGMTALCYAIDDGYLEAAAILFKAGADITFLPMNNRWQLLNHIFRDDMHDSEFVKTLNSMLQSGDLVADVNNEAFVALVSKGVKNNKHELLRILTNHHNALDTLIINFRNQCKAKLLHKTVDRKISPISMFAQPIVNDVDVLPSPMLRPCILY